MNEEKFNGNGIYSDKFVCDSLPIKKKKKKRKKRVNDTIKLIGEPAWDKIWKKADDAIWSMKYLSDIYSDVPPELDNIFIEVLEIHSFPKGKKRAFKKWVNRND